MAHGSAALRTKDLKRVTVDTTRAAQGGQLPDRRQLFHAAIKGLTHLTHMHGVRLRQSDEAGTKQGRPCGVPASLKEPGTAAPPILNKVSMPS